LILIIPFSFEEGYSQGSSDFIKYEDPEHGFNIDYHKNWSMTKLDSPYANVMFMSPGETAYDEFGENVLVVTETLYLPLSLEEYFEVSLAQLNTPNFELIETEDMVLSGYPAKKIVTYDKDLEGLEFSQQFVMTVKDNMGYTVAYTATPNSYNSYLSIFDEMITSFEIYEMELPPLDLDFSLNEFSEFNDNQIQIEYPPNWNSIELEDPRISVVFMSPSEGPNDLFSENVIVIRDELKVKLSLNDYSKLILQGFGSTISDYNELESKSIILGELPAKQIVFSGKDPNVGAFDVQGVYVWTIEDNIAYAMMFVAEKSKFSAYLPAFEKMIETFKIEPIMKNSSTQIPDWIRNNAKWWVEGAIGDSDFVSGIQFLIKEGIMTIPETVQGTTSNDPKEIPSWIKNNADWWAQGLITDDDFLKGITFLVEQGIIVV
jgi:hypothetical protein